MTLTPAIGRIVIYVPGEQDVLTEPYPAIIVRVLNADNGVCNIEVFTDGGNDPGGENVAWRQGVMFSETTTEPGTWHWPPRV